MANAYTGIIIEESLRDNRLINEFTILAVKISNDPHPADRWHLYTVQMSEKDIEKLSKNLKSTKYYAHFWKGNEGIVAFNDKLFRLKYDKKETWEPAIQYGLSIGVPKEQLTFTIK